MYNKNMDDYYKAKIVMMYKNICKFYDMYQLYMYIKLFIHNDFSTMNIIEKINYFVSVIKCIIK